MPNPYKSYLALGETVDKSKSVIAQFSLQSQGQPFDRTAGGVAAESSVGTWTDVGLQLKSSWDNLHAKVVDMDETSGLIKIAYPIDLFEPGNIPQLLSSIAGNIFGLLEITTLRILDIEFPESYVKSFPGPMLGLEGIKKLTQVFNRPLIGSIIKPKLGLSPKDHIEAAMEVFEGGGDLVKDDENLTSQWFNNFYQRVDEATKRMKEKSYLGYGGEKIYAFNITSSFEEMVKRAEYVNEKGGNCHMVDILTVGFAGLCGIRNRNYGKMIHAHRAMHAAFTRSKQYGISMLIIAKLARLAGVDSLHTGTVVGKMEGEEKEVLKINEFLRSEWYGLKPVLPVASGGLHPGHIPELVRLLGNDMLMNFGGGIHGHPQGTNSGTIAVRQAFEAVSKGLSLEEYSNYHPELAAAVEKWVKNNS